MTEPAEGSRTFLTTGDAYDRYMGRYSRSLAAPFADQVGVAPGQIVLDVGCGPGALTGELVARLGAAAVFAFDPSPPFVAACAERHPGVDVRQGRAEAVPFDDDVVDSAMAQLVLHFVSEPEAAMTELRRVVRPGGTIGACVWDFAREMEMLRHFWDAALAVDPGAPDEARTLRFGNEGELSDLFTSAGLVDVVETTLTVSSTYSDFDELWAGFLGGIGPAGAFCLALPEDRRAQLRDELFTRVGSPAGSFSLAATARTSRGRVPG